MKLTPEQVDSFWQDGYLLSDGFLDTAEVAHLRECYIATVDHLVRNEASLIIELRKIIRMIGRAAVLGFQLLKTYARVNLDI